MHVNEPKPQLYIAGMGMETPCGHIDFYPNGGYDQPGCSLFDMPVSLDSMVDPDSSSTAAIDTMGRHLVACSHNRGIELYIESLQEESKCHFIGHECESDEKFQDGLCFDCGLRHSALKSLKKVQFIGKKPHCFASTAKINVILYFFRMDR